MDSLELRRQNLLAVIQETQDHTIDSERMKQFYERLAVAGVLGGAFPEGMACLKIAHKFNVDSVIAATSGQKARSQERQLRWGGVI